MKNEKEIAMTEVPSFVNQPDKTSGFARFLIIVSLLIVGGLAFFAHFYVPKNATTKPAATAPASPATPIK